LCFPEMRGAVNVQFRNVPFHALRAQTASHTVVGTDCGEVAYASLSEAA
jgi:hypothetical protein